MAITVNINNIEKNVYTVSNNINGVWRQSYNIESYNINIYRYGEFYETIKTPKGSSVALPSYCYGFATTAGSTDVVYNAGEDIVPTSDLDLYIVFQYSVNIYRYGSFYDALTCLSTDTTASFTLPSMGVGFATSSTSTAISYDSGATITSGNTSVYAVYDISVKLYKYGTLYDTLTKRTQSSTATFTLPSCTVNSDDTSFYGWTKTSEIGRAHV